MVEGREMASPHPHEGRKSPVEGRDVVSPGGAKTTGGRFAVLHFRGLSFFHVTPTHGLSRPQSSLTIGEAKGAGNGLDQTPARDQAIK